MISERGCWDRLVDYLKRDIRCECGTGSGYSYPKEIVLSRQNILDITGSQDSSLDFDLQPYATQAGYDVGKKDGDSYLFKKTQEPRIQNETIAR